MVKSWGPNPTFGDLRSPFFRHSFPPYSVLLTPLQTTPSEFESFNLTDTTLFIRFPELWTRNGRVTYLNQSKFILRVVPEVPEVVLTHPSPLPILIPLLGSELPIGELPQNIIHSIPLGGCGKIFSNFLMLNGVS